MLETNIKQNHFFYCTFNAKSHCYCLIVQLLHVTVSPGIPFLNGYFHFQHFYIFKDTNLRFVVIGGGVCVCVWGLKCSCRSRWRCVWGEWWDGSGTKPALSLPSQSGKPRQIILELTATKIEWAWFPLFCVCVHALPFFLVSVCLSHSLPLSFPPAVIFVLFAHSPNPILAWLLAYLLYYQTSVFLGKWTCECRCVRECVSVWMFHVSEWPHPIDLWRNRLQTLNPRLAQRSFQGSAHFFVCLMFLGASSKCNCLYIGASPIFLIYNFTDRLKKSQGYTYVWKLLLFQTTVSDSSLRLSV